MGLFLGDAEILGFIAFMLYGVAIVLNNMIHIIQVDIITVIWVSVGCAAGGILLAITALILVIQRLCRDNNQTEILPLLYTDGDHQMIN
jgi:TRAP-type C4-dicarboxylate transport system permease small subunit